MTVLLDTNVFIWCITGQQSKLSRKAFEAIEDPYNIRWLSAVSLWEIAIKVGAGKLDLPKNADYLKTHMDLLRIGRVVPVEAAHALADFGCPVTIATHSTACWSRRRWSKGFLLSPAINRSENIQFKFSGSLRQAVDHAIDLFGCDVEMRGRPDPSCSGCG
jgi:PIN domain nuclease of toxin-antitoxin system